MYDARDGVIQATQDVLERSPGTGVRLVGRSGRRRSARLLGLKALLHEQSRSGLKALLQNRSLKGFVQGRRVDIGGGFTEAS